MGLLDSMAPLPAKSGVYYDGWGWAVSRAPILVRYNIHLCDDPKDYLRLGHRVAVFHANRIKARGTLLKGQFHDIFEAPVNPLKRLLKERGIEQREIADAVGVTQGMVSMVVTGKRRSHEIEQVLAKACGLRHNELFPLVCPLP